MPSLLRRIFRFTFHAAACFSALALVACLIFWPLSYHRSVCVSHVASTRSAYALRSLQGQLQILQWEFASRGPGFHLTIGPVARLPRAIWSYTEWVHGEARYPVTGRLSWSVHRALGCELVRGDSVTISSLHIPFSYLVLLAALLPALWLHGWVRRRRRAGRARRGFPVEPVA